MNKWWWNKSSLWVCIFADKITRIISSTKCRSYNTHFLKHIVQTSVLKRIPVCCVYLSSRQFSLPMWLVDGSACFVWYSCCARRQVSWNVSTWKSTLICKVSVYRLSMTFCTKRSPTCRSPGRGFYLFYCLNFKVNRTSCRYLQRFEVVWNKLVSFMAILWEAVARFSNWDFV